MSNKIYANINPDVINDTYNVQISISRSVLQYAYINVLEVSLELMKQQILNKYKELNQVTPSQQFTTEVPMDYPRYPELEILNEITEPKPTTRLEKVIKDLDK